MLDVLRRGLAIRVDYLDSIYQDGMKQRSNQRLTDPWAIDDMEKLMHSFVALPCARQARRDPEELFVSARSGYGMFLHRTGIFPNYDGPRLTLQETGIIITQLFATLVHEGLLSCVKEPRDKDDVPGYQLMTDSMFWHASDGRTPFYDTIRMPRLAKIPAGESQTPAQRTNAFFVRFYKEVAVALRGIEAREHTAQVPSNERERREDEFLNAKLPLLYCFPTMELGVDIDQLNVVNMRNVPPPSGQLHPAQMVSGAVRPPRLDLGNEDLIRAHIHSVWLAETGQSLYNSLKELLDIEGETPKLTVKESVIDNLREPRAQQRAAARMKHHPPPTPILYKP